MAGKTPDKAGAHDHPDHSHGDTPHGNHSHEGHSHVAQVTADSERRILLVLVMTATLMVVEVVGGLISGSLALIADAGHMLTDAIALFLAWLAFRLGRRPSDSKRTFGYHRLQVLAAFVNGLTLFLLAGWIVFEAIERLQDPQPILGGTMLLVAIAGAVGNLVGLYILQKGDSDNLNVKGALLHVLGDLLGSVAAIGAAVVIMLTGWTPIDPILSVLVSLLILRGAWLVVRNSAHILVEGAPGDIDVSALRADLKAQMPDLVDIHHVHVWSLTAERPLLTMHAIVGPDADRDLVLSRIVARLRETYGIGHATVQMERIDACPDGRTMPADTATFTQDCRQPV